MSVQAKTEPAPRWMFWVLTAAGIYNLAWGLIAIAFPLFFFRWAEMDPPRYPELWQCIGMIVGVYGIGYLIAARAPDRHWPIVLVGFLGKLFGPIGFAFAIFRDRLPASFGATIITNDLIWWVPFAAILWYAFRTYSARQLQPATTARPIQELVGDNGETLYQMSQARPVLIVLLRHAGCTFHREALADLAAAREALQQQGVQLAVVHMGAGDNPAEQGREYDLGDAVRFADPSGSLYRAFGLDRGTPFQLLGPKVWWRGLAAVLQGHGVGCLTGDGFQMPGVFLLDQGKVISSYKHRTAADRPDYVKLAKSAPQSPVPL